MPASRPNVVFILSDQHNAKVLGHKGHPDVQTPNLDRMAEGGVSFQNAITQNPICTPSRTSWLSGQYCHNHGYYGLSGPEPRGLPTVFGHFRAAGYRTAAIGKIHCPENWVERDTDVFHETCHCGIDGRSEEYTAYLEERGLTYKEDHEALHEFGDLGRQTVEGRPSMVSYEDGPEGWSVQKAIEFMECCSKEDTPFFVHVSLPKPHQCYTPAQRFWDLYDPAKLTLPPNSDYDMSLKAPHFRVEVKEWRETDWQLIDPKTFEAGRLRKLQGYLGNVSHVDHAVGELLDWLEQTGAGENTIVVYSSDHGDYACEHDIMEKAPGICSDAITRIPMIWSWPGRFKAGHVAEELVESVDLVNTLCSLTGLDFVETADGKDISHMLSGEQGDVRSIAVTEFAWSKSVRKGKYRLVHYVKEMFSEEYPDGFGELYDLEEDPWEMKNLFFEPGYSGVVAELEQALLDWLITTTRARTINPAVQHISPQSQMKFGNAVNPDGKIHPDHVKNATLRNYI